VITRILKWVACTITIAGAICITLNISPLNMYLANAGSFLYMIWGIRIKESNIVLVNAMFLVIYGYGLFLRLQ
jgi:hypothetical protein